MKNICFDSYLSAPLPVYSFCHKMQALQMFKLLDGWIMKRCLDWCFTCEAESSTVYGRTQATQEWQ